MNPPIPKPACQKSGTRQPENLYTQAQLLAYRAEVIEMCAEHCAKVNTYWVNIEAAGECADAIRSLK